MFIQDDDDSDDNKIHNNKTAHATTSSSSESVSNGHMNEETIAQQIFERDSLEECIQTLGEYIHIVVYRYRQKVKA